MALFVEQRAEQTQHNTTQRQHTTETTDNRQQIIARIEQHEPCSSVERCGTSDRGQSTYDI